MNMSVITNAVKAIVGTILKLNSLFDKERSQLKGLEKALNGLGNPGYYFKDDTYFYEEEIDYQKQEKEYYYLLFEKGKIKVLREDWEGTFSREQIFDLSELSLGLIEKMLERLPNFLQGYRIMLEDEHSDRTIVLENLTKVVEAINSIVAVKA